MAGIIDDMKDMKAKMGSTDKADRMKELEMKAKENRLDDMGKAELERLRSGTQHHQDEGM
jgi:hypothetical protein